jgi:hypothetical protein
MSLIDAGLQMYEGEEIAFATEFSHIGNRWLIVTTVRIAEIRPSGVRWWNLTDVKSVRENIGALGSGGGALTVKFSDETVTWNPVTPRAMSRRIASAIAPDAPSPAPADSASQVVAKATVRYLGGSFNRAPRRDGITAGDTAELRLLSTGQLHVVKNNVSVESIDVRAGGVSVDRIDNVRRAVKAGPLAATAAATLLLGPLGLIGLTGSTERRDAPEFTLLISEDSHYALFAFLYSSAALSFQAKLKAASGGNGNLNG